MTPVQHRRALKALNAGRACLAAAMRWTWEAVHSGTSPSLGVPATGKRVRSVGCSVFRFRDGKVAEQWEYGDMLGLLQQLEVIPALG
jgi:predicted ester cyclase